MMAAAQAETLVALRREQMFPRLTEAQIARLALQGRRRASRQGEILFDQGDRVTTVFVVLSGEIEVAHPGDGRDDAVTVHGPGEFTGETHLLTGARALVRGRVRTAGELLEVDRDRVRELVQTDAELSEVFMRAFLLRRMRLIAGGLGDAILIGSNHSSATLRIREFLTRNGHPFTYVDVDTDPGVAALLDRFRVGIDEVPVVICRGERVLRKPTNEEVADCLGLRAAVDAVEPYDVIVAGAGPAGLAAAVYAASEGLHVLVLEVDAPGGQAGTSSRIENYLGFPTGISGQALAARAFAQAQKFGAEISIARTAARLHRASGLLGITLGDGTQVRARTVVVATGARYNKLPLAELGRFEGSGVYYSATRVEAQLCGGERCVVVGGGNSAGQAAVFLADRAEHVHMLVRGGLAATMSRYLIRRIEQTANITLHPQTEVEALEGNGRLEQIRWRDGNGVRSVQRIAHVFLMTGASPNTRWLGGCVALDDKGFVKTGLDLTPEDIQGWQLRRRPFHLETSLPGVFAVGDVRAGSVKRVAAAVGEGSTAVALIHKVLSDAR